MKFSLVWDKAMTLATVKGGFGKIGNYLFNTNRIHKEAFAPSSVSEKETDNLS